MWQVGRSGGGIPTRPMRNGIYNVAFQGPAGAAGSGVCYIEHGTLRGGDAGYAYFGSYTEIGQTITVTLHVLQHAKGHVSVFGDAVTTFALVVSGLVQGEQFTLTGGIPGKPGLTISIQGQRVADAPG